ncbi:hypothetical protein DW202_07915 [Coprobacillus sp. AM17-34]|jgi:hypothetical protein|uniref:LlaJI family restriction endonuclease n=1 Tax=Faecalibacillus intestinalis TaxID=1982626 RepID=A0AAW4VLG4_9FIRM|nr:hypothetical protein [Faecalibacillus intestinalis]MCB8562488.1 hypothetical protein [Faecalibacillus intestinalis]MCG4810587.1 hypothetical protein [Faecalibacillus intestinalis]RHO34400.1 hypothetical protein DW202_07915 [Coprobacillus sp. AM17-34]RHP54206.1 hypothetical protein DWZ30_06185 [Coprobacillus sp. AF31-1BH]
MEIELIQDGKVVDYNKYQEVIENVKESLFRRNKDKETKEWMYISNFVGILLDKDRLILSLPKSVIIKDGIDKEILLYKYARLFDLYFVVNEKKCDLINKYESIENWCKKTIEENKTSSSCQEIITFKFEMVFEWMIGEFFQNQISIQKGDVLFNSQLLDKEIDINDTKYNTYHWNAIGKQTKDHKQKQIIQERESVFINQNKKNIPDIVCERILENPKYDRPQKSCCILDAKYYGWDYENEAYYLPGNLDIYKQFFYQEQFQRIYEKENESNVGVYNFLVLPDYLGDTKDTKWGIIRQCAVIEFDYHQSQKIAILQVDIEKLVDFIYSGLDMKEDVLSVFLGNSRVVPMIYDNEKV